MRKTSKHDDRLPVVIVGAGPYGLSIAAHLSEAGIAHRIFGGAMQMWRERMPVGMTMKSDGFASNLSAGRHRRFTFQQFCVERGIPYVDRHHAMPLEHFIAYGLEFQRTFVPNLDPRHVSLIERLGPRFKITLDDGETVFAGSVICATGIMHFPIVPSELSSLSPTFLSHSSHHSTFDRFKGKKIAVLGAGASAMHTAALLHESGAEVTVIARRSKIVFHERPTGRPRSFTQRVLHPSSKLGPGLRSWLSEKAPQAFHSLPSSLRHKIVATHLGPSSSWHLKDRVEGKVRLLLGRAVQHVETDGRCVKLTLRHEGREEELLVDHVIAATGYGVDLNRLSFLSGVLNGLRLSHGAPALDRCFQSSIPGLYFVGTAAALSFGPLFRFAAGAPYAARIVTRAVSPVVSLVSNPGTAWQVESGQPPVVSGS